MFKSVIILASKNMPSFYVYAPAYGITNAVVMRAVHSLSNKSSYSISLAECKVPSFNENGNLNAVKGYVDSLTTEEKVDILVKAIELAKNKKLILTHEKPWWNFMQKNKPVVKQNLFTGSYLVYLEDKGEEVVLYKPCKGNWQRAFFSDVTHGCLQKSKFYALFGDDAEQIYNEAKLSLE